MSSFFGELKRRNVVRVGIAYAIVAWLVTEVSSVAFPALHLPDWTLTLIVVLTALGFPFALLFAWAFELTPEGLKRTHEVPVEASVTPATGRKLDFMIIGVMAVALIYFISTHEWGGKRAEPEQVAVSNVVHKSIAVLPFANLSPDEENAFFASGVHEDILTYLSKVQDLRVIARTSVLKYSGTGFDLSDVAAELGVAHILEGSVRRAGNRVRISAQLIDGKTQEHLWAENYDRELTDVFEIQTDVAKEIVAALEANLTDEEQLVLEEKPTNSVEAYDLYIQARSELNRSGYTAEKFQAAEPLLVEAIELDPDFALAHSKLADVHLAAYWYPYDRTEARLAKAKAAIDKAFELRPGLPEAQGALGNYYYRVFNDYQRALEHLSIAHERMPSDPDILEQIALCQRRLNQWDAAFESFRQASALDPAGISYKSNLAETLIFARRFEEAEQLLNRLMKDHPGDSSLLMVKAELARVSRGDLNTSKEVLKSIEPVQSWSYFDLSFLTAFFGRDYEGALQMLEANASLMNGYPGLKELIEAEVYVVMGRKDEASKSFESARSQTEQAIEQSSEQSGLYLSNLYGNLGIIAANLGERELAIRHARKAQTLYPESADSLEGTSASMTYARVLAMTGETELALDEIERLLSIPSGFVQWELHLDPAWDFMRDNERFVALTTPDGVTGE